MAHANHTQAAVRGRSVPTVHYAAKELRAVLKAAADATAKRGATHRPLDDLKGDLESER